MKDYRTSFTQIIKYVGRSKDMQGRKTVNAIEKINQYERKWKIRTNPAKFDILPVAAKKTAEIIIDGAELRPKDRGKLLGLNLTREGFTKHITKKKAEVEVQASKLKRFRNLTTKTKLKLYKSLIRPILEYPPVSLHLASKTQKHKLQIIQNKFLRWAVGDPPPYHTNIEELHRLYKLEPLNKRMERQAKKIWNKISINDPDKYEELRDVYFRRNHSWWPRSIPRLEREEAELFTM